MMHLQGENVKECFICKSQSFFQTDYTNNRIFYACPVCGKYEIGINKTDRNKMGPYLFYNRFDDDDLEYRYHTTLEKELCDQYRKEFISGNNTHGMPVHMDNELVERWYPSFFAEKLDYIVRYIGEHTYHAGQPVVLSYQEVCSLFFVDREDETGLGQHADRNRDECLDEIKYMLDCLMDASLITYTYGSTEEKMCSITMAPKGFSRLDEIQRDKARGNIALVAMQFGDETNLLRKCIKQGITEAGYNPILIDEVEHNNFITPEIMKYIRDSKFVVADLTHQNNGAYFEEGYAMGLGKPVIQLCRRNVKLHFDIAQKNTIVWDVETDIPLKLKNRIKATIE